MKKHLIFMLLALFCATAVFTSCSKDDEKDEKKEEQKQEQSQSDDSKTENKNAELIVGMWQPVSYEMTYTFNGETTENKESASGSDVYDYSYFLLFDKSGKVTVLDGTDAQKLVKVSEGKYSVSGDTFKDNEGTCTIVKLDNDTYVYEKTANDGSMTVGDKVCSKFYEKATYKRITDYKIIDVVSVIYSAENTSSVSVSTKDLQQTVASGEKVKIAGLDNWSSFRGFYDFMGWNTSKNGSGTAYTAGQEVEVTSNLVLYPIFNKLGDYKIVYDVNGGTGDAPEAVYLNSDFTEFTFANPDLKKGTKVFKGWSSSATAATATYSGTLSKESHALNFALFQSKVIGSTTEVTLYAVYN